MSAHCSLPSPAHTIFDYLRSVARSPHMLLLLILYQNVVAVRPQEKSRYSLILYRRWRLLIFAVWRRYLSGLSGTDGGGRRIVPRSTRVWDVLEYHTSSS